MAARLYDEALLEKLKSWTQDTNMHIYNINDTKRLFEVIASENKDKPIKLPIICLRRNGGYQTTNINKKPLTFDGMRLSVENGIVRQLNAIPIKLDYQLDIYCKQFDEADEYARNFIFNIINYPTMKIDIPYNNQHYIHNATLRVAEDIEDNSDIPERLIQGQFTRLTLNINIDDAYLWNVKERKAKIINTIEVETTYN